MKPFFSFLILISVAQLLVAFHACDDQIGFDYFLLVQQWPGSYCATKRSCCYPTTGKPERDFGIHGLWPENQDGSYPLNCNPRSPFDPSAISDLISKMQVEWPTLACPSADGVNFWAHEWVKHGTCSNLDQHAYFEAALSLKDQSNLLNILTDAGIQPDGSFYSLDSIKEAVREGTGHTAFIQCNYDESGDNQLFQIFMCVDTSASEFIDCPVPQDRECPSEVKFPEF